MKKSRLQIQLDPQDYQVLRSWAEASGVSMSAAVRMLLREKLVHDGSREATLQRFQSAAGSIAERSPDEQVSREHDRFLYGHAPE